MRRPEKEMARPWRSEKGSCISIHSVVRCWAVAYCVPARKISTHSAIDVMSTSPPLNLENAG